MRQLFTITVVIGEVVYANGGSTSDTETVVSRVFFPAEVRAVVNVGYRSQAGSAAVAAQCVVFVVAMWRRVVVAAVVALHERLLLYHRRLHLLLHVVGSVRDIFLKIRF